MELEKDRLSSLPKIILHRILSRLPEKDRARTSVLSKAWLDTWYTFSILSFSDFKIPGMPQAEPIEDSERKIKTFEFCDYVKRRMLKFRDQSLTIKEFKLDVSRLKLHHISNDINIWLKLACESGVEVIQYQNLSINPHRCDYHLLPISVLEAKSLTKLVLEGSIKIDPIFTNHSIKLFSLRVLSLRGVLLADEHAINNLISFCPLIEYITLDFSQVLSSGGGTRKSLSISGLQKLKSVDVSRMRYVSIDALSLESLRYYPNTYHAPANIDFDRCRNLKELILQSVRSTFLNWFLELFLKFPFLEILKLNDCGMTEKIDISSVRLKTLELSHCSNLKEVNIDAQNLLSFGYNCIGASEPTISFSRNSSQLEVNIHIKVDYEDPCNLREFVQNIKPNNVLTSLSLSIRAINVGALDLVSLQVSSPPPSIKQLDIHYVTNNEYLFSSLVNILLSSCCPTTISFRFHLFSRKKAFIEFFYETLMREKENDCFCSADDTKCWWHDLKDVKVTSTVKIDENVDFKTILESLQASVQTFAPQESISFTLEF